MEHWALIYIQRILLNGHDKQKRVNTEKGKIKEFTIEI